MADDQFPSFDDTASDAQGPERTRRHFPKSVFGVGRDPDVRFSLANERTFLAWIRTSLALLAGGVALESLALGMQPGLRLAASIILIVTGIFAAVQSWIGWTGTERALRTGDSLPPPQLTLPTVLAVVVAGLLVLIGVFLG